MPKSLLNLLAIDAYTLFILFCTSVITWPQTDAWGDPVVLTHVSSGTISGLMVLGFILALVGSGITAARLDDAKRNADKVSHAEVALWLSPGSVPLALGFMTLGWRDIGIYQFLQNFSQFATIGAVAITLSYLALLRLGGSDKAHKVWMDLLIKFRPESDRANLKRCYELKRRLVAVRDSELSLRGELPDEFLYQVKAQIAILGSIQMIIEDQLARDEFRIRDAFKYVEVAAENSERYVRLVQLSGLPAQRKSIHELVLPAANKRLQEMVDKVLDRERISIETDMEMLSL